MGEDPTTSSLIGTAMLVFWHCREVGNDDGRSSLRVGSVLDLLRVADEENEEDEDKPDLVRWFADTAVDFEKRAEERRARGEAPSGGPTTGRSRTRRPRVVVPDQ